MPAVRGGDPTGYLEGQHRRRGRRGEGAAEAAPITDAHVEIRLGQHGAGNAPLLPADDQEQRQAQIRLVEVHRVANLGAGGAVALLVEQGNDLGRLGHVEGHFFGGARRGAGDQPRRPHPVAGREDHSVHPRGVEGAHRVAEVVGVFNAFQEYVEAVLSDGVHGVGQAGEGTVGAHRGDAAVGLAGGQGVQILGAHPLNLKAQLLGAVAQEGQLTGFLVGAGLVHEDGEDAAVVEGADIGIQDGGNGGHALEKIGGGHLFFKHGNFPFVFRHFFRGLCPLTPTRTFLQKGPGLQKTFKKP